MSLMNAIRRATGGAGKPRLEDEKPEEVEAEEGEKETGAETEEKEPDAEDEEKEPDAENDELEEGAEGEEDKNMNAAQRAAFAKGRSAERKRIGAILGSPAAEANPTLAAHLAFATADSPKKALAALKAAGPAAGANGLSARMNARRPSQLGRGGESSSRAKDAGAVWDSAMTKAGVNKTKGK